MKAWSSTFPPPHPLSWPPLCVAAPLRLLVLVWWPASSTCTMVVMNHERNSSSFLQACEKQHARSAWNRTRIGAMFLGRGAETHEVVSDYQCPRDLRRCMLQRLFAKSAPDPAVCEGERAPCHGVLTNVHLPRTHSHACAQLEVAMWTCVAWASMR